MNLEWLRKLFHVKSRASPFGPVEQFTHPAARNREYPGPAPDFAIPPAKVAP